MRRPHRIGLAAVAAALLVAAPAAHAAGHPATKKKPPATAAHKRLVAWTVDNTLQVVGPAAPPSTHVGDVQTPRIVYDPTRVDADGNVAILGLQNLIAGKWTAPSMQPATNGWTFNVKTGAIDLQRAVVHGGQAIVIVFTPLHWLSIYLQSDGSMAQGGPYAMDPAGPQPCDAKLWFSSDGKCAPGDQIFAPAG